MCLRIKDKCAGHKTKQLDSLIILCVRKLLKIHSKKPTDKSRLTRKYKYYT